MRRRIAGASREYAHRRRSLTLTTARCSGPTCFAAPSVSLSSAAQCATWRPIHPAANTALTCLSSAYAMMAGTTPTVTGPGSRWEQRPCCHEIAAHPAHPHDHNRRSPCERDGFAGPGCGPGIGGLQAAYSSRREGAILSMRRPSHYRGGQPRLDGTGRQDHTSPHTGGSSSDHGSIVLGARRSRVHPRRGPSPGARSAADHEPTSHVLALVPGITGAHARGVGGGGAHG